MSIQSVPPNDPVATEQEAATEPLPSLTPQEARTNAAAEIGLALLTVPVNRALSVPLCYPGTTEFIKISKKLINMTGLVEIVSRNLTNSTEIVEIPEPPITYTAVDYWLYHALLFFLAKGVFRYTPLNNEVAISLACSPAFIEYVTHLPWYQDLKVKAVDAFTLENLQQFVIDEASAQAVTYVRNFIPKSVKHFARDVVTLNHESLHYRFRHAFLNFVDERRDMLGKIRGDVSDISYDLRYALTNGIGDFNYAENASRIVQIAGTAKSLVTMPSFSLEQLYPQPKPLDPSTKTMTAWEFSSYFCPGIAPLLLTSSNPDLVELGIRVAGLGVINFVQEPNWWFTLSVLGAVESANKYAPLSLRQHPTNIQVRQTIEKTHDFLIELRDAGKFSIDECPAEWRGTAYKCCQIVPQVFFGILPCVIGNQSGNIASALFTASFVEDMGLLLQNMQLADSKYFAIDSPMSAVPWQLAFGCAMEHYNAPALLVSAASIPYVVNKVTASRPYKYALSTVTQAAGQMILGEQYARAKALRIIDQLSPFIKPFVPKPLYLLGQAAVGAAIGDVAYKTGCRIVNQGAELVRTAVEHSDEIMQTGQFLGKTYGTYYANSTIAYYLGSTLGGASVMIGKNRDPRTLTATAISMVTGYLTDSPACAALMGELSYALIPRVQAAVDPWISAISNYFYPSSETHVQQQQIEAIPQESQKLTNE